MCTNLEDAMKAMFDIGDVKWTALLAIWLQCYSCLRLCLIITKSVPVERFDDWILFFCMQGKHAEHKEGFYWGAPTRTSAGWDWARPFLDIYSAAAESDVSRNFIGCIFNTDDYHHFTPKEAYLITHAALCRYYPGEMRTAVNWRGYLTTLASMVGISDMEQTALADSLDYAQCKNGMSRRIKIKLSEIQKMFRFRKLGRIADVTTPDCEAITAEASRVYSPMPTNALWTNRNVVTLSREGNPK